MGIDALIEESENGNPTGKFIALQIKSGRGNFSISENKITYYISNIHYNYWLNFDIPVLLIAHIPESEKTYWIEISERNMKRTKKRWKIDIPLRNELNQKAKRKIAELLTESDHEYPSIKIFMGENIEPDTIYDIAEKINCIADSTESTRRTISLLEELTSKSDESAERFRNYNKTGQSFKSPQVIAAVGTYAKNINLASKRFENECEIFSETFGTGIFAFEQAILVHYKLTSDIENLKSSIESVEKIPISIDKAIGGIEFMRNSLLKLPVDYRTLTEAKKQMASVLDLIVREYKVAKTIVLELIESSNLVAENNR